MELLKDLEHKNNIKKQTKIARMTYSEEFHPLSFEISCFAV